MILNLVDIIPDISNYWNEEKKYFSFDLIDWLVHINAKDLEIHYTSNSIDDVIENPSKKYYFVYDTSTIDLELFSKKLNDGKLPILLDLFKQKNVRILFMDSHEGVDHKKLFELSNALKNNNIDKDRFLYINNDSLLEEISENLWFIVKKWNHLFINTSNGFIESTEQIDFKTNRDFTFLSINKMIKPHRLMILSFLKKYNLLKNTNYSCLHHKQLSENESLSDYITSIFNSKLLERFKTEIGEVFNWNVIQTKYENGSWKYDESENINFAGEVNVKDYEYSYINITTESNYNDSFLHISEKSLKPFAMYQLPIIVGSPYHLKFMRELYDLDMFDDFIDHSYDLEEDSNERFIMIIDEILRLSKLENELPKFFKQNKKRFESNREKIKNIGIWKEKKLLNFILNM